MDQPRVISPCRLADAVVHRKRSPWHDNECVAVVSITDTGIPMIMERRMMERSSCSGIHANNPIKLVMAKLQFQNSLPETDSNNDTKDQTQNLKDC